MFQIVATLVAILRVITRLLGPWLDCVETCVCRFVYGKQKELPPITDRILLLSATRLAEKIRKKELRSEEVMLAYQKRVLEVQPLLNAMVDERFEEALKEAKEVDRLVQSGDKSEEQMAQETPLLGVPFSAKEALAVTGLYQTSGLVQRKGKRAQEDADVVKLYRKAGAIPYAVTNIPELCMWVESSNRLYGITNNPYDFYRTCGGSSGGEGALISSAGGVIGIGNDFGGSIRIPSTFNGIFGHKPTSGIVSNKGMYPPIKGMIDDFWQTGPMVRYAEDLLTIMTAIAGKDERLKLKEKVNLKKVTFYYMEDNGSLLSAATPDIKNAVKKAAMHFQDKVGAKVQKVNIQQLKHGFEMWVSKRVAVNPPLLAAEMADFKGQINPTWELLKWMVGQSDHTLPIIYFALIDSRKKDQHYSDMLNMFNTLENEMTNMLSGDAVFLYPTQPEPAHHHHMGIPRLPNCAYTCIFNVLGFPSTQVPAGLSRGLPIGIQAISGRYNDRLSLATAVELEKVFNGWTSPGPIILRDD